MSHAYPILSFRKPSWSVSNRSFPVLTVLPVWMTGVSSAASSTSSSIELANKTPFDGSLMIDSTHLKAHRTAASLLKKGILHIL